jgi:hypothetical protein
VKSASGRSNLTFALSALLCGFTLAEVNYARLGPQAQLAVFAGIGLVLCFLNVPLIKGTPNTTLMRVIDGLLVTLTIVCCGYIVWQTEPAFASSTSRSNAAGSGKAN